jgi:hypothetical protein
MKIIIGDSDEKLCDEAERRAKCGSTKVVVADMAMASKQREEVVRKRVPAGRRAPQMV